MHLNKGANHKMTVTSKFGKSLAIAAILGTVIIGGSTTTKAAETQEYKSDAAVNFITNTDPTDPVDPEDPDPGKPVDPIDPIDPTDPIEPGTDGPLSIDFASSFNFGTGKITTKDTTYQAYAQQIKQNDDNENPTKENYRPNYLQVTDNRGTEAGWDLKVKQEQQLTSTEGTELKGAVIKMTNGTLSTAAGSTAPAPTGESEVTLVPGGEAAVVATAAKGQGAGLWSNYFGSSDTTLAAGTDLKPGATEEDQPTEFNVIRNSAVTLSVPGASVKTKSKYTTELTWVLSEVAANGGN